MKTDIVTVKVKVSLPRIQLVTTEIGPIVAGSEVGMERWKAEVLVQWGMVEWPRDSTSLLARAYASRDKEQGGRTIEPLEDPFHAIPEVIGALQSEGLLTQKVGAVRTLLEDISSSRTNKITRAARMGQDLGDALSPEEMWLYKNLRKLFDVWRVEFEKLVEPRGSGE
jgi:hypothetical protein